MEIVLYQPEIAGNVGAIIRLAANTGIPLHIIETEVIKEVDNFFYFNNIFGDET